MLTVYAAAILSTVTVDSSVDEGGGDYAVVEFDVPAGAAEILITRAVGSAQNILDFGVWSPDGFRGWGGGLTDDAIIGESESSRGYLVGPLTPGRWQLVVGKARLVDVPASFSVTITTRDDATLAVRPRAGFDDTPIESGARWYAGDLHVHSSESGDASATFDEISALAAQRAIDFVVLSDHNTVSQHALAGAFQSSTTTLLIRGNEVTTYGGHGNALGSPGPIDHRVGVDGRTRAQIIADVVSAGGHFVVNHPALELGGACIGCAWDATDTPWEMVTALEVQTGPYATVELFGKPARDLWDQLHDDGHRITAVGGSDDHKAGIDLSGTQSPIGSPTTLVFADELSEAAIVAGIAAGRVVVQLSGPTDPRVELEIVSDSGDIGHIGDAIGGEKIEVTALVSGGGGAVAVLVIDGERDEVLDVVGQQAMVRWNTTVPAGGARYRVEVLVASQLATLTNHVFVDFAEGPETGCGCASSDSRSTGVQLLVILLVLAAGWRRITSSSRR